jgi:hypothetical protein
MRRWLVPVVLVALVGGLAWGLTRFLPRSPIVILVVCALAVVTMKLVEHRVHQLFRLWEERERRRSGRGTPGVRGPRAEAEPRRNGKRGGGACSK